MEEIKEQFLERIRKDFDEYKHKVLTSYTKEEIFDFAYKDAVIQNFLDGIEYIIQEELFFDEELMKKALRYDGNLILFFWQEYICADYDLNSFFKEWADGLPEIVIKILENLEN